LRKIALQTHQEFVEKTTGYRVKSEPEGPKFVEKQPEPQKEEPKPQPPVEEKKVTFSEVK
jgi:hypothetical protein